jgi:hypothetical protein
LLIGKTFFWVGYEDFEVGMQKSLCRESERVCSYVEGCLVRKLT